MGLLITILIGWLIFALFEGLTEARLWHYKNEHPTKRIIKPRDAHIFFAIQRGFVLFVLSFIVWLKFELFLASFIIFVANSLVFSFVHNGAMYAHRNWLSKLNDNDEEIYPKKWFDQSTTSTALTTKLMTPVSRTIQFIVGILLYIVVIIFIL